jgi:hypothetical protein
MIVCLMYVYAYGFSWFGCTIDVFSQDSSDPFSLVMCYEVARAH